jgi:predicted RNA-binding protein with PUA-like domain
MQNQMKLGHRVLFYHSNCKVPGIAGLAEISKEGYPDRKSSRCPILGIDYVLKDTAWDSEHPYHDPKSDENNPKWYMVDLQFDKKLPHLVPLKLLQNLAEAPADQLPSYISEEEQSGEACH